MSDIEFTVDFEKSGAANSTRPQTEGYFKVNYVEDSVTTQDNSKGNPRSSFRFIVTDGPERYNEFTDGFNEPLGDHDYDKKCLPFWKAMLLSAGYSQSSLKKISKKKGETFAQAVLRACPLKGRTLHVYYRPADVTGDEFDAKTWLTPEQYRLRSDAPAKPKVEVVTIPSGGGTTVTAGGVEGGGALDDVADVLKGDIPF